MRRPFIARTATGSALIAATLAFADTFEMRDGSLVKGRYAGGTTTTVRVETVDGVNVVPTTGNVAVAKAGSTVTGQVEQSKQAGRLAGKPQLALSLTGVDLGGGNVQPIMTTNFAETGKGEGRRTSRNVAAGALIGNAVDNDGGAGKGAAVGAGVLSSRRAIPSPCPKAPFSNSG